MQIRASESSFGLAVEKDSIWSSYKPLQATADDGPRKIKGHRNGHKWQ